MKLKVQSGKFRSRQEARNSVWKIQELLGNKNYSLGGSGVVSKLKTIREIQEMSGSKTYGVNT
jgi:hypothetical protein